VIPIVFSSQAKRTSRRLSGSAFTTFSTWQKNTQYVSIPLAKLLLRLVQPKQMSKPIQRRTIPSA